MRLKPLALAILLAAALAARPAAAAEPPTAPQAVALALASCLSALTAGGFPPIDGAAAHPPAREDHRLAHEGSTALRLDTTGPGQVYRLHPLVGQADKCLVDAYDTDASAAKAAVTTLLSAAPYAARPVPGAPDRGLELPSTWRLPTAKGGEITVLFGVQVVGEVRRIVVVAERAG